MGPTLDGAMVLNKNPLTSQVPHRKNSFVSKAEDKRLIGAACSIDGPAVLNMAWAANNRVEETLVSRVQGVLKENLGIVNSNQGKMWVSSTLGVNKEVLGAFILEKNKALVSFKFNTTAADKVALDPDPEVLPLKSFKKQSRWKQLAQSNGGIVCDDETTLQLGKRIERFWMVSRLIKGLCLVNDIDSILNLARLLLRKFGSWCRRSLRDSIAVKSKELEELSCDIRAGSGVRIREMRDGSIYLSTIFASSNTSRADVKNMVDYVERRLSPINCRFLDGRFSEEEVKKIPF
ncbi:hypothetical protein ACOSQ2_014889 [Xanthoceras sorbifolium]